MAEDRSVCQPLFCPGVLKVLPRSVSDDDLLGYVMLLQASLVAQTVEKSPARQETWVRSLGWEDPLEEGKATHSSVLAWRIPMDRGAWRATVHKGGKESDVTE